MSLITNYIPGNFFPGENFPIAGVSPTILTMRMLAWGFPDAASSFFQVQNQTVGNVVSVVGLGYGRYGVDPGLSGQEITALHTLDLTPLAVHFWDNQWIYNFRLLSYTLDVNSSHVGLGGFGRYTIDAGADFQSIRTQTTRKRAVLVVEKDALGAIAWYLVTCDGTSVSSQAITAVQANQSTTGHWISLWWRNGEGLNMYVDGLFWARKSDVLPSGGDPFVCLQHSVWGSPPGGTAGVFMTVAMMGLTPVIPNLSIVAP